LSTNFARNITTLTFPKLVYVIAEKTIKEPPFTHNVGNRDAPDYDLKLTQQKNINSNGFVVETAGW
jgi:hypothetical protein